MTSLPVMSSIRQNCAYVVRIACVLACAVMPCVGQYLNHCILNDGRCSYRVHVMPYGCDADAKVVTNQLQNDYENKVNDVEKRLAHVRLEHMRRIKDLENKIHTLNKDDKYKKTTLDVDVDDVDEVDIVVPTNHKRHKGKKLFHDNPKRKENGLLNLVHNQFSHLRRDLATTRRKLRETENELDLTKTKLNRTESMLSLTTNTLRVTEKALDDSKAENRRLEKELHGKVKELNDTKDRLQSTQKKLRNTELELWDTRYENGRLKKELSRVRSQLDLTRRHLNEALAKYHELNVRHDITVQELHNKTSQLIECYRGKSSMFCGFEDETICGFEQDNTTDQLDWQRHNSHTPSPNTGPENDHTCGNARGFYMFVESSSQTQGKTAQMISPKYQSFNEQCVEFWYHMFGRHIGTLNVYTRISEEEFVQSWRAFGNQGNVWSKARISIKQEVAFKGYQMIFEAIMENGYLGDIAIDDFRVLDGPCVTRKVATKSPDMTGNATFLGNTTITNTTTPQTPINTTMDIHHASKDPGKAPPTEESVTEKHAKLPPT